jgi:hypothetical protein
MLLVTWGGGGGSGGVWELDVPLVVRPLGWFICFLRHGSFHFVPCFSPFWVLWFIHGWHGFIIIFGGLIWPLRGLTKKKGQGTMWVLAHNDHSPFSGHIY